MAEMESGGNVGDSSNSISDKTSVTFGAEMEDEKERTIAKAALSIAELGSCVIQLHFITVIRSLPIVSGTS